jgi:hypothetical protein
LFRPSQTAIRLERCPECLQVRRVSSFKQRWKAEIVHLPCPCNIRC